MPPTQSNRSPSFVVKTRILHKITFVFKNQSHYSDVRGQRVKVIILPQAFIQILERLSILFEKAIKPV